MAQAVRFNVFAGLSAMVALSFAIGCSSVDHDNQAGQDMSSALSDAREENEQHASACRGASSMGEMMDELARHEDAMAGFMSRMDGARERMRTGSMMSMHCSGARFDHMSSSLTDMDSEASNHSERMHAAESLDDARTECAAHTDEMREMMARMMDDLDSMPCMAR